MWHHTDPLTHVSRSALWWCSSETVLLVTTHDHCYRLHSERVLWLQGLGPLLCLLFNPVRKHFNYVLFGRVRPRQSSKYHTVGKWRRLGLRPRSDEFTSSLRISDRLLRRHTRDVFLSTGSYLLNFTLFSIMPLPGDQGFDTEILRII